ncbi:PREDICTED: uncharacterized protein LOC106114125 [Papilio xuthus]|uniref:Uncharacterized protein LOC106114125 n=2 Tax=Papilio xuthus TaxID=66420 RepID=A0AAJ6Z0N2_PAPXU|nr:PREDICTED: uncharacterized protein LOC106114125 [Papilio xuthus]
MEICFVLLILFIHQSYGIIYRLDDTEYKLMPPLNYIDDYDSCLQDSDALYCTMQLKLVSDTPNVVMDLITNYSAWDLKHFDHSKLYRGVCVTRTCNMNKQEVTMNLNNSLETCMNEHLWKQYKLKAKLLTSPYCYSAERDIKLDFWDIIVGSICILIIIVNIVATLYDIYVYKKPNTKGMDILLSFSIIRSWSRLQHADYRIKQPVERLKGMDGIRAIIMIHFVFGHSILPLVIVIANPHDFEKMYSNISCHILLNGSLIVQAYFVMSGILLSYNIKRTTERNTMTWKNVTNNLFKRWLRLIPSFAICLALESTLMRHFGAGPLWQLLGTRVNEDCRRYWMWNFFFLANYNSGSYCMPHTWHLAADMHMFCFGLIVFALVRNKFWKRAILASAFLIGIISSGIVTYIYDLRTLMTVKPNSLLQTFTKDPNFDYLYKPTHTNAPAYVIGLITGVLIYRLQKSQFDIQKYKKFRILYWMLLPTTYVILVLNIIHYQDGPPLPSYIRVFHQMLLRPLFAAMCAAAIVGFVFKIENFYRAILEWDGWIWVAHVAYTTYITQFTVMGLIVNNTKTLNVFSKYILVQAGGITIVTFAVGVIVWLLIDGPFSNIVKICMETPTTNKQSAKLK